MAIDLATAAEVRAKRAEALPAFSGLNLLYLKKSVAALLGQIGGNGIFDQYTKHDISHIDAMLQSLDWIIPEKTQVLMSEADWLMIVLAVYFHDIGMLVTRDEYRDRDKEASGFRQFVEKVLFSGTDGEDYKGKILQIPEDDRDRFLYQEFIRSKHAERVRSWISGQASEGMGCASAVYDEVNKALGHLSAVFRRDLGLVCESHHLSDLYDTKKYKVSQPYGNSSAETANLQYAAVLLRTADLLHMTSDRTPSVEFRIINPSDPVSQREWSKQMAVKCVRQKIGVDQEGRPDENSPRDTIEVHAYFESESGFFGLTSYLAYAGEQLKKSNDWIAQTVKQRLSKHEFPWRHIDDANIETRGFLRDAFEFTIDQAKILDLLTGHTLYNDTNVVLRELVQNSIDAIRLQFLSTSARERGKIFISWDSRARSLSVRDNGTGMTQKIINDFLLRVGSSRYQDPEFKKTHPDFASISRFGIGVLSTFMIADAVDVLTCHPDDEFARRLMLRSVHGKYLIRLLDKNQTEVQDVHPHGTLVRLHVRPSVEMGDIVKIAKHWIVVPECSVEISVDGSEPVSLGHPSVVEALRAFLKSLEFDFCEDADFDRGSRSAFLRLVEREVGGVTLAYALRWDPWFREWCFLTPNLVPGLESFGRDQSEQAALELGICVEGVRIVPHTPGFESYPLIALANVRGKSAPRTNVARSGLEVTPERDAILSTIYGMYAQHVTDEIENLTKAQSFSLTWAVSEAAYLLYPLLGLDSSSELSPIKPELLQVALHSVPCVLVEDGGRRSVKSVRELQELRAFWTIDSGLLRSAEWLIREVASNASLQGLFSALGVSSFEFPASEPVVCGAANRNPVHEAVFSGREIEEIRIDSTQRRVDLRWAVKASPSRWLRLPRAYAQLLRSRFDSRTAYRRNGSENFPAFSSATVAVTAPSDVIAVRTLGSIYLFPGFAITEFARSTLLKLESDSSGINAATAMFTSLAIDSLLRAPARDRDSVEFVLSLAGSFERFLREGRGFSSRIEDLPMFKELMTLVGSTTWEIFDASVWSRNSLGPWQ